MEIDTHLTRAGRLENCSKTYTYLFIIFVRQPVASFRFVRRLKLGSSGNGLVRRKTVFPKLWLSLVGNRHFRCLPAPVIGFYFVYMRIHRGTD